MKKIILHKYRHKLFTGNCILMQTCKKFHKHSKRKYVLVGQPTAQLPSPSILHDGSQGHPLFLPAAWDRPVTMRLGIKTVYTRTLFIQ
jgi:hypothetical protein